MYQGVRYRRAWSRSHDGGGGWLCCLRGYMVDIIRLVERRSRLLKTATTLASLAVFLCFLPLLAILYAWMKCWRAVVRLCVMRSVEGMEGMVRGGQGYSKHHTHTLLMCLEGSPSLEHIRDSIQEEVVERVDKCGQLIHPNLRHCVENVCGYLVWRRYLHFDIKNHVIMAQLQNHGRFITHRNIQECVSEIVSQPLPPHLPQWQVSIIPVREGSSYDGGACTWVVARAHHTLAADFTLPNLLATAHPDPWRHPAARGLTLLSAPAATKRLTNLAGSRLKEAGNLKTRVVEELKEVSKSVYENLWRNFVAPVELLFEEATQSAQKVAPENLSSFNNIFTVAIMVLVIIWGKLCMLASSIKAEIKPRLNVSYFLGLVLWGAGLWARGVVWGMGLLMWGWWRAVVWGITWPWLLWGWGKTVWGLIRAVWLSNELKMIIEASVEMYWMLRAVVSLPRLVLTEAVSAWGVRPLNGWIGRPGSMYGRRGGVAVAWSDPVPLSTARGVRGATGATLSEVLLTASAGAVRDYLRVTGLTVPDQVRCSLSVYSHHHARARPTTTPGFVTLPLPTGAPNATSALQQLRGAMENIRRYPEQYLASMWLMQNLEHFLPEVLLGRVHRALAATCPVLLSNLAGPPRPEVLWGHNLLDIFCWRPPHDGAVVSVCVTSYRGEAVLGVAGDARVVPGAATLPQAFVTHLNELAVETGVRLERQSPRHCWFRNSSPSSSPAPTPPPTPTFTPKHDFKFPAQTITPPVRRSSVSGYKFTPTSISSFKSTPSRSMPHTSSTPIINSECFDQLDTRESAFKPIFTPNSSHMESNSPKFIESPTSPQSAPPQSPTTPYIFTPTHERIYPKNRNIVSIIKPRRRQSVVF